MKLLSATANEILVSLEKQESTNQWLLVHGLLKNNYQAP